MKRLASKHTVLLALFWCSPLFAETTYVARGSRVDLGTVVPGVRPELRAIDLGPAAPPGSSRLFSADAIRIAVREAGYDPSEITLPRSVRVTSPARRLSPAELSDLARPRVERALPAGVILKQIKTQIPLTISPEATVGEVELPALPKRVGPVKVAATLQLMQDGIVHERIPFTLSLQITKEALAPEIKRGTAVTLVIQRGSATVSTDGSALEDASVGDTARFRVLKTGRVVRAKLSSPLVALVTEGS